MIVDEPTDLPDGSKIELRLSDEDDLDALERAALEASIERGIGRESGSGSSCRRCSGRTAPVSYLLLRSSDVKRRVRRREARDRCRHDGK
jgi:hypothetical protein